jgi:steroid delta-isomerase-like uncharacterized protein
MLIGGKACLAALSLGGRKGGHKHMSAEENKALVRRVLEEMFNKGNLDVADALLAPHYVDHDPAMPEDIHGPEGFKQYVSTYRSAFSDLHLEIEDQIAEGDKVVTRWTGTGTHDGELVGIPPTGNRVTLPGMEIVRISDGKLVEGWEGYDMMNLMRQLDVM